MELNQLTISQAQDGLRKKKFSSVELIKACLRRIKKIDHQVNALITVCQNEALKEALKADKILNSKTDYHKRPLLGIPVAIKDNFCTLGIKTTAASKVLKDFIPVYEATAVKKLRQAGAIIIGKANLDAWAHGSSGENSYFGPTKNPWDLTRVSGGSSSGPAASVAAGMCLAATGSDTGGSIRLPASFCGVVGLKPTYGRVSRYGVIAMASSLDAIGHLSKDVTDAAIILKITAGADPLDATTPSVSVPNYVQKLTKPLKALKIGIPKQYFAEGIQIEIKTKIEKAIKKLETLGIRAVEISLPHSQYALAAYYIIQPSEVASNLARYDGIRYGGPRKYFADEAKRRIMLGTYALSAGYYDAYYLRAMKMRTLIKEDFRHAFQKVDLILAPVSPDLPFKLGEKISDPLKMYLSDIYTVPINLAGLPAISLPCGFSKKGLPIGMQIIGPQFSEDLLFQAAYTYEQATDWSRRRAFKDEE